ncbi:MAG: enolase-phosphatase E1 [Thalassolituus sp.]|jgi:enolase-phosphatase E1
MQNIKLILTDIEGTTSSISFVKDVLFPYAAKHLPAYVKQHIEDDVVKTALQQTAELAGADGIEIDVKNTDQLIKQLLAWITEDRKATPLKTLQGLIWKTGYENGDYQAHMYPDATEYLKKWHREGMPLYVYSSGSVKAQKLFFGYSQDGDLLPLFNGHFDTQVGGKRDAQSYKNILVELQKKHSELNAEDVLFLSDIKEELDAARDAGIQTVWLIREDKIPAEPEHKAVKSFAEI